MIYLGDGQRGAVHLLSLHGCLGPGLHHVGAEEGPQGAILASIGLLVVWWGTQLGQDGSTVLLWGGGGKGNDR